MKKLLIPSLLLAILLLVGCTSTTIEDHIRAIRETFPNLALPQEATPEPAIDPEPEAPVAPAEPEVPSVDAVPFGDLAFTYGSFDGSRAAQAPGCLISNLAVTTSGLAYKWVSGGCEALGAASASDANCLACLFCQIDDRWVGGKFDWISTSRQSRSFTNIIESYNGWDPDAVNKATAYAFVIVSKDGKRRSNVAFRER